jgi:dynein light chain Tctex-type 1
VASSSSPPPTPWKFAVNSTIIQHLSPKATTASEGAELVNGKAEGGQRVGRRGMHSACGAYWNNEKDGMWSYKYETKGMDVVISVIWIAV